jgi:ElaB protein
MSNELNRAKGKMTDDLKTIVSDGEELLKAAASASGEGFTAARAKFAERVSSARARLSDLSQPAFEKARLADDYVHGSPWTVIGVVAAAGILIGLLAAKR